MRIGDKKKLQKDKETTATKVELPLAEEYSRCGWLMKKDSGC